MAVETKCQTPGVIFNTHTHNNVICVELSLPFNFNLDEQEAEPLEMNIHNALELVLAPHFKNRQS